METRTRQERTLTRERMRAILFLGLGLGLALISPVAAAPPVPAPTASPSPAPLAPGDVVTAFQASRLDGTLERVDFPKGKNTLVLFFLSSCPVCHRMIPLWNEFYARHPKDLEVFGVMLDREPPGFFDAMPISFPVLRSPGPALNQMFRLRHVPFMVRVGPGGRVDSVSEGITDPIKLGELFRP
jgi:thiol-disulfide isomerase/thioredoxin